MLQEQSWPLSCLSALRDGLIDGMGSAAQRGELWGAVPKPSTGTSAPCEVRGQDPAQGAGAVGSGCPHDLEWDRAQLGEQNQEESKGKM